MRNTCMLLTFLSVSLCALSHSAYSQDKIVKVESGGFVRFSVNSLHRYTEGVELERWTRLAIKQNENWDLKFLTVDDQIWGDYGNSLPLEYLEVQVFDVSPALIDYLNPSIVGENNWLPLSQLSQDIITNAPPGDFEDYYLHISYRIGKDADKPLLGRSADYYDVIIYFELTTNKN